MSFRGRMPSNARLLWVAIIATSTESIYCFLQGLRQSRDAFGVEECRCAGGQALDPACKSPLPGHTLGTKRITKGHFVYLN